MNDRHQTKPYPLRMPDEMREALKKAADDNHRSMNAEIVSRLKDSFEEESKGSVTANEHESLEFDESVSKILLKLAGSAGRLLEVRVVKENLEHDKEPNE